jgi:hypothetical protein
VKNAEKIQKEGKKKEKWVQQNKITSRQEGETKKGRQLRSAATVSHQPPKNDEILTDIYQQQQQQQVKSRSWPTF